MLLLGSLAIGAADPPEQADGTAKSGPSAVKAPGTEAVTPDPRFARREPPPMPVALSPESRRMVLAMQNKYTCGHSAAAPATAARKPAYLVHMDQDTQVLRQSLGTLPDACYVTMALPKIVDPATSPELSEVLFEDLLKRPDPIKLRMLFILASLDGHPLAARALENLKSTMNLDHQQDWLRWDQAVVEQAAHEERGMRGADCRSH